ncbi:MAG: hypothetical protein GKR90_05935 [Pseudomonadales bacterium]|nr:hypothetical protein [Pseudomonadales bacterium]
METRSIAKLGPTDLSFQTKIDGNVNFPTVPLNFQHVMLDAVQEQTVAPLPVQQPLEIPFAEMLAETPMEEGGAVLPPDGQIMPLNKLSPATQSMAATPVVPPMDVALRGSTPIQKISVESSNAIAMPTQESRFLEKEQLVPQTRQLTEEAKSSAVSISQIQVLDSDAAQVPNKLAAMVSAENLKKTRTQSSESVPHTLPLKQSSAALVRQPINKQLEAETSSLRQDAAQRSATPPRVEGSAE